MVLLGETKVFLPGMSVAVKICTNPGMTSALLVSIDVIIAFACEIKLHLHACSSQYMYRIYDYYNNTIAYTYIHTHT